MMGSPTPFGSNIYSQLSGWLEEFYNDKYFKLFNATSAKDFVTISNII